MRKSSFHFITGDRPLNQIEESVYRLSAWFERLLVSRPYHGPTIQPFRPKFDRARLEELFGPRAVNGTTSRILCFDFILQLGGGIFGPDRAILDLGCGTGIYARHIRRAFGYRSYQGCDIEARPEWAGLSASDTRFGTAVLGVDPIAVDDIDVVFSQSVLEHIEFDVEVFHRLRAMSPRRLRHLHLVPGVPSFIEHKLHGFRRYAPWMLDRLLDVPGIANIEVHAIGNWASREMHWLAKGKPKRDPKHPPGIGVVPYDPGKSVLDNMIACRDLLVTDEPTDAAFYALVFNQTVSG